MYYIFIQDTLKPPEPSNISVSNSSLTPSSSSPSTLPSSTHQHTEEIAGLLSQSQQLSINVLDTQKQISDIRDQEQALMTQQIQNPGTLYSALNNIQQLAIFWTFWLFVWTNCLISYKNNTKYKYSNLTVRLIISQELSSSIS